MRKIGTHAPITRMTRRQADSEYTRICAKLRKGDVPAAELDKHRALLEQLIRIAHGKPTPSQR